MPWEICGAMVRGASGNGPFFVYQNSNGWHAVGEFEGNGHSVLKSKTKDYHDIRTNYHLSYAEGTETIYQWTGEAYKPKMAEWYDHRESNSQ